jgi:hypothetical protein
MKTIRAKYDRKFPACQNGSSAGQPHHHHLHPIWASRWHHAVPIKSSKQATQPLRFNVLAARVSRVVTCHKREASPSWPPREPAQIGNGGGDRAGPRRQRAVTGPRTHTEARARHWAHLDVAFHGALCGHADRCLPRPRARAHQIIRLLPQASLCRMLQARASCNERMHD